jgi:hypothetical protein
MMSKLLPVLLAFGMSRMEYRMKNVVSGIGLMLVSGFFVLLAVVFGLMSMFFALADMDHLIAPSLITGGVIILIAILVAIEGKRVMYRYKKPLR